MSMLDYGARDVDEVLPSSDSEVLPDWLQQMIDDGIATPARKRANTDVLPPTLGWGKDLDSTGMLLADRNKHERY